MRVTRMPHRRASTAAVRQMLTQELLDAALVGIVMSIGPIISTLSGVPAGRLVDRLGAPFMVIVGLFAMAAGSLAPDSNEHYSIVRPAHSRQLRVTFTSR